MSIFIFYKILTSILQFYKILTFLQFLSRLTSDSTTFKVAVSHFVFYPCGALSYIFGFLNVLRFWILTIYYFVFFGMRPCVVGKF